MTDTVPTCPHCGADISVAIALATAAGFDAGYQEGVEYERQQWRNALDRNAEGGQP